MTDIRFILLASVGLIVRAPRPVAIDIRLFPPGVVVLPGVPALLPGVDCPDIASAFCGSGVLEGVSRLEEDVLLTRTDFVLRVRGDFDPSLPLEFLLPLTDELLDFLPPILGLLFTSTSPISGGRKVPGPTDFLGAFGGGLLLLKAFGGK